LIREAVATGDEPSIVADVVLKAASAKHPKLRYTAGGRAYRLRLLRRFASEGMVDAGVRKSMRLDALPSVRLVAPALAKQ